MASTHTRSRVVSGFLSLAALGALPGAARAASVAAGTYAIAYSDAQWRARLTPEQFAVLRRAGTEAPGSSPLLREHRPGTFACAACALPLFDARTKFESGTGWPSFYAPLDRAIGTTTDRSLFATRTEVHCSRCGSHLGHVFDDGPKPTGSRYCMNGIALAFKPR
ncbi:MAG: peptide-methionine (R)-S-oxide reductase MsrB [Vulcanimicrobiaceae bacterium]